MDHPWGRAARFQPTIRPTEYRCYIKEDVQYATAGAVTPSWNTFLRPPGKLPVPVALNARSPTLFGLTIHHFPGNVKRVFGIILRKLWGAAEGVPLRSLIRPRTTERYRATQGRNDYTDKAHDQPAALPPIPGRAGVKCRAVWQGRGPGFVVFPGEWGLTIGADCKPVF